MVIQRTIENLRERSTDERRAVALGIAIFVVAVLFFAWAIFFFRKVQNGTTPTDVNAGLTSKIIEAKNTFETPAPQEAPPAASDLRTLQIIEDTGTTTLGP